MGHIIHRGTTSTGASTFTATTAKHFVIPVVTTTSVNNAKTANSRSHWKKNDRMIIFETVTNISPVLSTNYGMTTRTTCTGCQFGLFGNNGICMETVMCHWTIDASSH